MEGKVKLTSSCLCIGLMVGWSATANASAIHTSTSSYGPASPVTNTTAGDLNEQTYDFSDLGGYEVFDFMINTDTPNFTLKLTGDAAFLADNTDPSNLPDYYGFGAFIQSSGSCPSSEVLCTPTSDSTLSSYNVTASPLSSDGTQEQVSFTVFGDGKGLVFFAVEPETDGIDPNTNSLYLNNSVSAEITFAAAPEPRLWPVLGLGLVGLVLLRRFRSAKLG